MKVTLQDIESAYAKIKNEIQRTPVQISASASKIIGSEIFFKMENEQTTGSFKLRGAMNKVLSLSAEDRKRGIVASSAGNHAQGIAYAARKFGVESNVVMPIQSSILKQAATRNYGANVILHGDIYDDAYKYARILEKEKNYIFCPPFEDEKIIAGQGTIGLEILEDIKDLDSIIIPIGGGGLISGIATVIKTLKPSCKVYGVVAENAPAMFNLFKQQPTPQNLTYTSIADGISVKAPSPVIYENFISKYVDDIVSIAEDDIAEAIVFLIERAKAVVEGSGAISLAAAFKGNLKLGQRSCILLSGGNIDLNLVAQIVDRGLSQSGRVARLTLVVPDKPGQLNKITQIVAQQGANILEVEHDRLDTHLHIRETAIRLSLETKNRDHIEEIKAALMSSGFSFKK